mmetsp:Transcript_8254/g.21918  ORF Transcript_8254/g.21918 Transcript_8254/m.21918 type:complete len:241 (-) Transcript_8254:1614-2336(-)
MRLPKWSYPITSLLSHPIAINFVEAANATHFTPAGPSTNASSLTASMISIVLSALTFFTLPTQKNSTSPSGWGRLDTSLSSPTLCECATSSIALPSAVLCPPYTGLAKGESLSDMAAADSNSSALGFCTVALSFLSGSSMSLNDTDRAPLLCPPLVGFPVMLSERRSSSHSWPLPTSLLFSFPPFFAIAFSSSFLSTSSASLRISTTRAWSIKLNSFSALLINISQSIFSGSSRSRLNIA